MHIDITPENLLIQLGYPANDSTLAQMKRIIANTANFDLFSKHILSLSDEMKRLGGFIAMSNSSDYLKVKTDASQTTEVTPFVDALKKWADKYKVTLEKVEGKQTFYILGQL